MNSTATTQPASSLDLTLGPLRYTLQAHDAWGRETLDGLRRIIKCVPFVGLPDRTVHLAAFQMRPEDHRREGIASFHVPDRLHQLLPNHAPKKGWSRISDTTGRKSWYHPESSQSIWTYDADWDDRGVPCQLPWYLILADIIQFGGGVLHGGIAVLGDRGLLFTAPPGGGKTTALTRIPSPWKMLSDDAALVWPLKDGDFGASPLPTWSVLLGTTDVQPGASPSLAGESVRIARLILLKKAACVRLTSLQPVEAAPHLYRAFSEHPMVLGNRDRFRHQLFRAACNLARSVPCLLLELTREGEYWSPLQDELATE